MRRGVANDLEHRRGLVLGLTLAEVLLLLLFLLLLALSSQIVGLQDANIKTTAERDALKEVFTKSGADSGAEKKLDVAIATKIELEKQIAALQSENTKLEVQLKENPVLSERLKNILSKASKIDPNDPPAILERGIAEAEKEKILASSAGPDGTEKSSTQGVEPTGPNKGKHNWPPIIILSEADKYTFASGSADLSPDFKSALSGTVIDRLVQIIKEYDVNVVEVVGHTDEQSLLPKYSNLDKSLAPFVSGTSTDKLVPSDNAGLGLARAVSVVKALTEDERLKGLSVLPLSGAQLIDIGDKISTANSHAPAEKRRRIEIRVRRSPTTLEAEQPQQWAPVTTSAVEARTLTGSAVVVDGDTFDLDGTRIRVWGVDAVESSQRCFIGTQGWDCGAEATEALKKRLDGEKVECAVQYKDSFGRTVAKCTVKSEDVGVWLVKTGMAVDFPRYSNGAYAAQQNDAHFRKVGIWRGEFEMPWDWRKATKEGALSPRRRNGSQ